MRLYQRQDLPRVVLLIHLSLIRRRLCLYHLLINQILTFRKYSNSFWAASTSLVRFWASWTRPSSPAASIFTKTSLARIERYTWARKKWTLPLIASLWFSRPRLPFFPPFHLYWDLKAKAKKTTLVTRVVHCQSQLFVSLNQQRELTESSGRTLKRSLPLRIFLSKSLQRPCKWS